MTRISHLLASFFIGLVPLASSASAAEPYRVGPGFLEGSYEPPLIYLQTPRRGVLQNPPLQYDSVRSYTNDRGGNPYDARSPLPYGAPLAAQQELVIVRPREDIPYIAISPWEPITDRTIEELERNYPYLRRTESIREDLVFARNKYLRERGYTGTVRGFTNTSAGAVTAGDQRFSRVFSSDEDQQLRGEDPQLVIIESDNQAERQRIVSERLKPDSVIRSSGESETQD